MPPRISRRAPTTSSPSCAAGSPRAPRTPPTRRRAPRRGAEGPERPRLHRRLRRRRHAPRRPAGSPAATSSRSRSSRRGSCPGTCAAAIRLGGVVAPGAPVGGHPDRPPRAARAWSATSWSTPPPAKLGPAIAHAPRVGQPPQPQPARRGRARRGRGRPPPRGHPRAARPRRRRLRVDQGVERREPALDVGVRRGRRARSSRSSPRSTSCAGDEPARRSSSTSTWRSTATSTSPIAVFTTPARPAAAARTSRPASCCRPTCPTRSARCRSCRTGRPRAARAGGAAHQGARGQGREPRHGAGRRRAPRLAARHLRHQAGHRHQLQARPRLVADARAHRRGEARRRRPQPVRRRARLAHRAASAASTSRVEFEMLLGMATGQAEAVRRDVGKLLLYTPVVNPSEFDVAIAYLIRRLEENASQDNFMSAVFELGTTTAALRARAGALPAFARGARRGRRGCPSRTARRTAAPSGPTRRSPPRWRFRMPRAGHRARGRRLAHEHRARAHARLARRADVRRTARSTSADPHATAGPGATPGFRNEPDTDPALAANRDWGRAHPRPRARVAPRHRHHRGRPRRRRRDARDA